MCFYILFLGKNGNCFSISCSYRTPTAQHISTRSTLLIDTLLTPGIWRNLALIKGLLKLYVFFLLKWNIVQYYTHGD